MFVKHPNGSYVSEFEDGTRFTVTASAQDESSSDDITIECPGFSRVTYHTAARECSLQFPDDSIILCSNQGEYTLQREGDYELHIENTGKVHYIIPNAKYTLDHTSLDSTFSAVDGQGNTFSLQSNAEATYEASKPVEHSAFAPRYFQLTSDKLAFELHKSSTAQTIISEADANPNTSVVTEALADELLITSTTIIEPVSIPSASPSVVSQYNSSIVPYNLRSGEYVPPLVGMPPKTEKRPKFGSLVGKGLEIGTSRKSSSKSSCIPPSGLKYRQFLHIPALESNSRKEVQDIVTSYIKQRNKEMTESDHMQPKEIREASEVKLAETLNAKFMETKLDELYEPLTVKDRKKSSIPVPPSMSQEGLEFIRKSKAEVEAAEVTKVALRNRDIPPYFESKYALAIEPPDMSSLTSKLAHPPPSPNPELNPKSPSTLQSSLFDAYLG